MGDDWIKTVETGTEDQFKKELAKGIDPLTKKVMGVGGDQFVSQMSYEMGQWIKDSSILWIKNKGAGSKTTTDAIQKQKDQSRWEVEKEELIKFYENQID